MTDVRVFFDFEQLRGQIEALADGGAPEQIRQNCAGFRAGGFDA